jgi:hypothetical protein
MQQGVRAANLETAKRLKKAGIAADTIVRCTGLTVDEVSEL